MDEQELIEKGRELIYQGGDHLALRKLLKELGGSDDQVHQSLIILENDFVRYQLAEQERSKVLLQVLTGFMILIFGSAVAIYLKLTGSQPPGLVYAIILVGAWWGLRNYRSYRQPVENFIPREEHYRKRRFRK